MISISIFFSNSTLHSFPTSIIIFVFPNFVFHNFKMNFSQAVRGQLTTSGAINAIQSQAETELGRNLSKEEESFLFSHTHPTLLSGQIQKYGYGFLKFQLFLKQRPDMSCEVSPNNTPRDGNCLIHGN